MTTLANRFFDSFVPDQADTFPALPFVAAEPARRLPSRPAPPMASSLWRRTLDEQDGSRPHRRAAQWLFGSIAALGIGSVAYALWETCAVMSGGSFHDAVAAFLR